MIVELRGQRSRLQKPRAAVEEGQGQLFLCECVLLLWLLPESFQAECHTLLMEKPQQNFNYGELLRGKCLPKKTAYVYNWVQLHD